MGVLGDVGKMAAVGGGALAGANPALGAALGIGGTLASLIDNWINGNEEAKRRAKEMRQQQAQSMMAQLGTQTNSALQSESANAFAPQAGPRQKFDPFQDPEFLRRVAQRYYGNGG